MNKAGRVRFAAATAALLALAQPAPGANDTLFEAMALISSGYPTLPTGERVKGSLVEFYNVPSGTRSNIISAGPGDCVVQQLALEQDAGKWAQSWLKTYDFRSATGFRLLGDADDFATAPGRAPDDPAVTFAMVDGKGWTCMKVIHVDPAKPHFDDICDDGWTVAMTTPEERKAAVDALTLVENQCFGK
ncbi:MAG TPA: hypothetical protein VGN97_04115 [Mesorhizobium sp.]|jgi:hypothetical protein|nr:hypothetical protein [Mesorhizobium sp.]